MIRTYYEVNYQYIKTLADGRKVDRRTAFKKTTDLEVAEAAAANALKEFGNARLETIELNGVFDTVVATKEY